MSFLNAVGFFCEDIREERSNKETFLGVFPDNVQVPSFPGIFQKLCIYVRIHADTKSKLGPIAMSLRLPDGAEHPLGGFEKGFVAEQSRETRRQKNPYIGLLFKAMLTPFPIPQAGRYIVVAKAGKLEQVCCAINVQLTPTDHATASAQPASQSPTVS